MSMPELRPPPQCQPRFGAASAATTHICPYQQQLLASWHVKRPKYLSCPQLLSTQRLGSPFSPQCAQAAEAVVAYDQCSVHDMATLSGGTEELGHNELQYRRGKQCQESQFGREHSASEAQYLVTGPREPAEQRQRRKWLWAGPPHVQSATPTDSAYSEPLQGGSGQQQARIASSEATSADDNAARHMNAGAQPHAAGGTRSQPLPEVAVQQRMLGIPALKVDKVALNGHRDRLATHRSPTVRKPAALGASPGSTSAAASATQRSMTASGQGSDQQQRPRAVHIPPASGSGVVETSPDPLLPRDPHLARPDLLVTPAMVSSDPGVRAAARAAQLRARSLHHGRNVEVRVTSRSNAVEIGSALSKEAASSPAAVSMHAAGYECAFTGLKALTLANAFSHQFQRGLSFTALSQHRQEPRRQASHARNCIYTYHCLARSRPMLPLEVSFGTQDTLQYIAHDDRHSSDMAHGSFASAGSRNGQHKEQRSHSDQIRLWSDMLTAHSPLQLDLTVGPRSNRRDCYHIDELLAYSTADFLLAAVAGGYLRGPGRPAVYVTCERALGITVLTAMGLAQGRLQDAGSQLHKQQLAQQQQQQQATGRAAVIGDAAAGPAGLVDAAAQDVVWVPHERQGSRLSAPADGGLAPGTGGRSSSSSAADSRFGGMPSLNLHVGQQHEQLLLECTSYRAAWTFPRKDGRDGFVFAFSLVGSDKYPALGQPAHGRQKGKQQAGQAGQQHTQHTAGQSRTQLGKLSKHAADPKT